MKPGRGRLNCCEWTGNGGATIMGDLPGIQMICIVLYQTVPLSKRIVLRLSKILLDTDVSEKLVYSI
jgi:hypothetical protein